MTIREPSCGPTSGYISPESRLETAKLCPPSAFIQVIYDAVGVKGLASSARTHSHPRQIISSHSASSRSFEEDISNPELILFTLAQATGWGRYNPHDQLVAHTSTFLGWTCTTMRTQSPTKADA